MRWSIIDHAVAMRLFRESNRLAQEDARRRAEALTAPKPAPEAAPKREPETYTRRSHEDIHD